MRDSMPSLIILYTRRKHRHPAQRALHLEALSSCILDCSPSAKLDVYQSDIGWNWPNTWLDRAGVSQVCHQSQKVQCFWDSAYSTPVHMVFVLRTTRLGSSRCDCGRIVGDVLSLSRLAHKVIWWIREENTLSKYRSSRRHHRGRTPANRHSSLQLTV